MKLSNTVAILVILLCSVTQAQQYSFNWSSTHARTWVGSDFWANRLQDWKVQNGRLECTADQSRLPVRTLHTLTHRLNNQPGRFQLDVKLGLANSDGRTVNPHALAGFLVGVGGEAMDYRAAAIVHQFRGPGAGILAGVRKNGELVIQDYELPGSLQQVAADIRMPGTLNRSKWKIVDVDSTEKGSPAVNILDGDDNTIWHTQWKDQKPKHPHHVTIDMGQPNQLDGFAYQPRKTNIAGRILKYGFYVSQDGTQWGEPVATGVFPNDDVLHKVSFKSVPARFIKLVALSAHLDRPSTTVAELYALGKNHAPATAAPAAIRALEGHILRLRGTVSGDKANLTLSLINIASGDVIQTLSYDTTADRFVGSIALMSHPGTSSGERSAGRFWFQDWELSGNKISHLPDRALGPIIGAQHTLSGQRLKMTAQLTPIGTDDSQQAHLEIQQEQQWQRIASAKIIVPGFTATFGVDDWDSGSTIPYRVVYTTSDLAGHEQTAYFQGTVRRDPVDKTAIVIAGFTGNHNVSHQIGQQPFDWRKGMWFPHQEISRHVTSHNPDVLFFSGDQIYEGRSPTFPDTNNILLDYLYKWYLWSWAYRDLTRNIPCVTMPDDHDVFQGNLWGEGGRKASRDHFGGYVHPAEFVKMVERTQTSHLPDPYDPAKLDQGIGVYYTGMTYGRISFAILEDRKFKSGCAERLPPTGTARPDHINNPDFDVLKADVPGLKLLGDRQLAFLEDWSANWKGADMKIALSQTIFANMATHHGGGLQYLIADLDSNGWPQTGRNKAIEKLRKGFAFHLAGDQHLATIVHHGIEAHNDSIWSFCVPSIANFYPRMWQPRVAGANRPAGAPPWQGEHFDGFRNRVTVYAATNPGPDMGHEPKALHNGMPGYGIVTMDKTRRTIRMECWPRFADPADPDAKPYPGWPKTIKQTDNYLRSAKGHLPTIETNIENPVIQVMDEKTGEVIYTLRILGNQFTPKVFAAGNYTIIVSEPDKQWSQAFKNIAATREAAGKLSVTVAPGPKEPR